MKNNKLGRVLRTIAIILIGTTAAANVLGGVGKVCAAFMTRQFPPLWALLDYQWLYQVIMVATLVAGLAGVWTVIGLARGGDKVVRNAIVVLLLAMLVAGVNVYASLMLREKAAPTDMRLYFMIFTLVFISLTRLPGLRDRVDFSKNAPPLDKATSAGLAAIMAGLVVLFVGVWAGPSHMHAGENWVSVLQLPLTLTGGGLLAGGLALLVNVGVSIFRQEATKSIMAPDG
jgi:hypothetical protein